MMNLSMTETYLLLAINGTGRRSNLAACQYSAGIVLGGIYELLQHGYLTADKKGRLTAGKQLDESYSFLKRLYDNISSRPSKTADNWLDYYCLSPTEKAIRPVIDDIVYSLEKKGFAHVSRKRGILKMKTQVSPDSAQAGRIVEDFRKSVTDGTENESVIFSVQMLLLADAFKSYFPMGQRMKIKPVLNAYRKSAVWKTMEPYTNRVRNFNYQNTVYTGASR